MFFNLTNLRSELLNRLKANSNVVGTSRIDSWLNNTQDDIANEVDLKHLYKVETFSSVADTRLYHLNLAFGRIQNIWDTTNDFELEETSEDWIRERDANLSDTGIPYVYSPWGWSFLGSVNNGSGVISIVSSSASDTTQKVRIVGTVDGVDDSELLTLNGTTTVPGSKSFSAIHSIQKNDNTTVGKVTVTHAGTTTTTLATIAPAEFQQETQPIYLWPVPSGVINYVARGYRRPRKMVNAEDCPDFPSQYHDLILWAALVKANRDLNRHAAADKIYKEEVIPRLSQLRGDQANPRSKRSPVIKGNSIGGSPFYGRYPFVTPMG